MNKQTLIIAYVFIISCIFAQNMTAYALCEGNFGSANSSLWSINSSGESNAPVYWDENSNPLGDVGQSLTIHNDKLYIIMNNSHTVEVMELIGGIQYSTTINLPSASPRYMCAEGDIGYVTSWGLNAILILNLNTMETIDTIQVNGMPEHIINYQNHLYVSVPSKSDWSTNDQVLKINKYDFTIDSSFTVEPGPSLMVVNESYLYIASSSYDDSWNKYAGTSSINLANGEILRYNAGQSSDYGSDIFNYQNEVYQLYNGGVVPLNNDLSPDTTGKIGDFNTIYSATAHGDYLYFGISDYVAPDTVMILNSNAELISDHIVGAIPGSFAFYGSDQASVKENNILPHYASMKNFPNPFNPLTNIQFDIKTSAPYKLYISNINGKVVENIQVSDYSIGKKNISWDASSFSSGIYFAILEQKNKTEVLKLSLIK